MLTAYLFTPQNDRQMQENNSRLKFANELELFFCKMQIAFERCSHDTSKNATWALYLPYLQKRCPFIVGREWDNKTICSNFWLESFCVSPVHWHFTKSEIQNPTYHLTMQIHIEQHRKIKPKLNIISVCSWRHMFEYFNIGFFFLKTD